MDALQFIIDNNLPCKFWLDFTTDTIISNNNKFIWRSRYPNPNIFFSNDEVDKLPTLNTIKGVGFFDGAYLKINRKKELNVDSFTIVAVLSDFNYGVLYKFDKTTTPISLLESNKNNTDVSFGYSKSNVPLSNSEYYIVSHNYPYSRTRDVNSKKYSIEKGRTFSNFILNGIIGGSLDSHISHFLFFSPEIEDLSILEKLIKYLPFQRLLKGKTATNYYNILPYSKKSVILEDHLILKYKYNYTFSNNIQTKSYSISKIEKKTIKNNELINFLIKIFSDISSFVNLYKLSNTKLSFLNLKPYDLNSFVNLHLIIENIKKYKPINTFFQSHLNQQSLFNLDIIKQKNIKDFFKYYYTNLNIDLIINIRDIVNLLKKKNTNTYFLLNQKLQKSLYLEKRHEIKNKNIIFNWDLNINYNKYFNIAKILNSTTINHNYKYQINQNILSLEYIEKIPKFRYVNTSFNYVINNQLLISILENIKSRKNISFYFNLRLNLKKGIYLEIEKNRKDELQIITSQYNLNLINKSIFYLSKILNQAKLNFNATYNLTNASLLLYRNIYNIFKPIAIKGIYSYKLNQNILNLQSVVKFLKPKYNNTVFNYFIDNKLLISILENIKSRKNISFYFNLQLGLKDDYYLKLEKKHQFIKHLLRANHYIKLENKNITTLSKYDIMKNNSILSNSLIILTNNRIFSISPFYNINSYLSYYYNNLGSMILSIYRNIKWLDITNDIWLNIDSTLWINYLYD